MSKQQSVGAGTSFWVYEILKSTTYITKQRRNCDFLDTVEIEEKIEARIKKRGGRWPSQKYIEARADARVFRSTIPKSTRTWIRDQLRGGEILPQSSPENYATRDYDLIHNS